MSSLSRDFIEDDFFPDWSSDVPHSTSLSERINLPSSVVDGDFLSNLVSTPQQTTSHRTSTYLTNRSPCLLFFYGTLSLPHILQRVLSLPAAPIMLPATVTGHALKMWGPYPALVRPGHGNTQIRPHAVAMEEGKPPATPISTGMSIAARVKSKLTGRRPSHGSGSDEADTPPFPPSSPVPVVANDSHPATVSGMAYWGAEEDLPRLLRYEGENYEIVECMVKIGQDEILGRTFVWCGYPEELTDGRFDPTMFPSLDGSAF